MVMGACNREKEGKRTERDSFLIPKKGKNTSASVPRGKEPGKRRPLRDALRKKGEKGKRRRTLLPSMYTKRRARCTTSSSSSEKKRGGWLKRGLDRERGGEKRGDLIYLKRAVARFPLSLPRRRI